VQPADGAVSSPSPVIAGHEQKGTIADRANLRRGDVEPDGLGEREAEPLVEDRILEAPDRRL
jgi:hypothetical protein